MYTICSLLILILPDRDLGVSACEGSQIATKDIFILLLSCMESQINFSPVCFTIDKTLIKIATKDIFILLLFFMESQIVF